jgi:NAD-dependent dihydropyrimidine dehydrogenase PreA subunit
MYPTIDVDHCDCCGLCVEVCPSEVYRLDDGVVGVAFPEECIECGACVEECPTACVALVED